MSKRYKLTQENIEEIRNAMLKKENKKFYKRLLVVALRGEGKKYSVIAEITKYHSKRASQLVSLYCNNGLEALLKDGRTGGNSRKMNEKDANEFLSKFEEKAKKGQVVTLEEISKAYDEATGKERKSDSSVYYFLHSHGWRIVMPR